MVSPESTGTLACRREAFQQRIEHLGRIAEEKRRLIPLEHDYTIDAAILASFLRSAYPDLRTQAAIVLLALATSAFDRRRLPVIGDVAVYVCAGAIWDATAEYSRSWESCATLAHLACREYARQVAADPGGRVDQHCLLAFGEAAAAVLT